jgi:hypothetical protein
VSIEERLAALRTPGPAAARVGTPRGPAAPRGWEPGVPELFDDGVPRVIVTPAVEQLEDEAAWGDVVASMGIVLPPGYRLRMTGATFDPAAWTRDQPFVPGTEGESNRKMPAVTRPLWRYRFAVEPAPVDLRDDPDLLALYRELGKSKRKPKAPRETAPQRAVCVVWADLQVGKTDKRGGTAALLERVDGKLAALDEWLDSLDLTDADAGYLLDAGDIVEGFENTPQQARTNDLQQTEQVRVARRTTAGALLRLERRFGSLTYATCGSNHCRVRRGKDALADPLDDWGIEIGAQLMDGFALNPAFEHVRFVFPEPWQETLALEVVPGKTVGLAHGHQVNRPGAMDEWWADQRTGPVADVDVLVHGHFHHARMQEVWEDRWLLGAPTLDNGSSWHENTAGRGSGARLMAFVVDEHGLDTRSVVLL